MAGPPLRDAAVMFAGDRIIAVGKPLRDSAVEDLGPVAIVPGLVNAHAHLEFSDLAEPIGQAGMSLVDWLGSVARHRSSAAVLGRWCVEQGLAESLRNGVTTVGEIARRAGTTPLTGIRPAIARCSWN